MKKLGIILIIMIGLLLISNTAAFAEEAVAQQLLDAVSTLQVGIDTVWVLFTAFLVFFMNLGFGMLEAGLCRAKNTVNILAKNFIIFAISSIAFWVIGWGFMFGDGNLFVGLQGLFFASGADNSPAIGDAYTGVYSAINWTGVPLWAKFFFQLVFAGTAATIVSGAVAERIKFLSFIVFSFLLVGFLYPFTGHWIWGEDSLLPLVCGILPVPPLFIPSAAGRHSQAFWYWEPVTANIARMAPSTRSSAIVCPCPPLVGSFSG